MKKTQRIELLKNIGNTKVSFISIIVFVMLGIALFIGLSWAANSVLIDAEKTAVDDGKLHDLEIIFPYGLEQGDLEALAGIEGVDEVEGTRYCYGFFRNQGLSYNAVIHQINQKIDTIIDYTGTLPQKENEIAVDTTWAKKHGVEIGDTISFLPDDDGAMADVTSLMNYDGNADATLDALAEDNNTEEGMTYLKCTEFKITALASSSLYLYYNFGASKGDDKYINTAMYVADTAWAEDTDMGWNSVLLRSEDLRQYSVFTEEYKTAAKALKAEVETTLNALTADRCQTLHANCDDILLSVKSDLDDADEQLQNAKGQLQSAKQELNSGKQELKNGKAELAEQEKTLTNSYNQLKEQETQLKAAYPEGIPAEVQAELDAGWAEYQKGAEALSAAKAQLNTAEAKLTAGEDSYQTGLDDYNQGKKEYQNGLADYNKLKDNFADIEDVEAGITLASDNISIQLYTTTYDLANKTKYSLSLLFLLVGLLVCYNSVSRIVYDQTALIGTKKALGLNNKEITASNLGYALSAAVLGCILGAFVSIIVAKIVLIVVLGFYFPGDMKVSIGFGILLIIFASELVLIALTAVFACRKVLKKKAVDLLKGEAPSYGKVRFFEKWLLWQKVPLLTKTIVNNFLNEKRRVLGTLIGITCCTTLIIMGLTMFINSVNTINAQYNEIYHFDTVVYFDSEADTAEADIKKALQDSDCAAMTAKMGILVIDTKPSDFLTANMIAPSDMEEFKDFMGLTPTTESDITPYEGAWLCEAFRNANGGSATQTVTAQNTAGDEFSIPLDGFFLDYSTTGELILTPEKYEEIYDKTWEANCFLVRLEESDLIALNEKLEGIEGFQYAMDFQEKNDDNYSLFFTLSTAIVGMSLVLSMIMAFLVILNLLTMFVAEKKRELIVLRINGYSIKKARKYIYSDTIFLTVISIVIAVIVGSFMGNFINASMECSSMLLIKEFNLIACLLGIAATALFVGISSKISLKKVNEFNLTDINK